MIKRFNSIRICSNVTTIKWNCKMELDLRWERNFIRTEILKTFRAVDPNADSVVYELTSETTIATFQINNAKFYVPIVTLSINDNIKF